MDTRPRKTVYAIVEHEGRAWWRPLGSGFVNEDGSIDIRLEALPVHGALRLQDMPAASGSSG